MKFKIGDKVHYSNPQNGVKGFGIISSVFYDDFPMPFEYPVYSIKDAGDWSEKFLRHSEDPNNIIKKIL